MKLKLFDLYNKHNNDYLIFEGLTPAQIKSKYYKDVPLPVFVRIAKADPKSKVVDGKLVKIGKYFKLMMTWYQNGGLLLEDLPRATEYLEIVYKHNVPINSKEVVSLSDLFNLVSKYIVNKDSDFYNILSFLPKNEYEQVFDGKYWMIFKPKTEKAACHLGVNTEWCTAWGEHSLDPNKRSRGSYYHQYSKDLFIIVNKDDTSEKYQFHFSSNQYMDKYDRRIPVGSWFLDPKNKEVMYFFFKGFTQKLDSSEFHEEFILARKLLYRTDLERYIESNSEHIKFNQLGMDIFLGYCDDVLPEMTDEFEYTCSDTKAIYFEFPNVEDICDIIEMCDYINGLAYLKRYSDDNMSEYIYDDYRSYFANYDEESALFEYVNRIIKDKFVGLDLSKYDLKKIFKHIADDLESKIVNVMFNESYGSFEQELSRISNSIKSAISITDDIDITVDTYQFGLFITKNNIDKIESVDHLKKILSDYYEEVFNTTVGSYYGDPYNIVEMTEYISWISYEKFEEIYNEQYGDFELPGYGIVCDKLEKLLNLLKSNFKVNTDGTYVYTGTIDGVDKEFHIVIDTNGNSVCENNKINIRYIDVNGNATEGVIDVDSLPDYMYNYKLFEYREKFLKNIR